MHKNLSAIGLTLVLAATATNAAMAQYKLYPWSRCAGGKCAAPIKEEFLDEERSLVWKLSHQPELMNLDYLRHLIGHPENERSQHGVPRKHYFWYDSYRKLKYELVQNEIAPGKVTESTMTIHLPNAGLSFDQLDSIYGEMSRRFFDYNGHPTKMFTFAPDTFLAFSSPPNSFKVASARILYRGAVLPPPSANDICLAEAALLAKTMSMPKGQITPETLSLLRSRINAHPNDPESHYLLGSALQQKNHLHEAIGEYKVALALSADTPDVRDKSLEALRKLRVIEPLPDDGRRRNFEIVQKGQRIEVKGHEKASKKDDG